MLEIRPWTVDEILSYNEIVTANSKKSFHLNRLDY